MDDVCITLIAATWYIYSSGVVFGIIWRRKFLMTIKGPDSSNYLTAKENLRILLVSILWPFRLFIRYGRDFYFSIKKMRFTIYDLITLLVLLSLLLGIAILIATFYFIGGI